MRTAFEVEVMRTAAAQGLPRDFVLSRYSSGEYMLTWVEDMWSIWNAALKWGK